MDSELLNDTTINPLMLKPGWQHQRPNLYIETYGCQMNVSDSEVVVAILKQQCFNIADKMEEADVILINTCSIRENAEQRIRGRLNVFKLLKKKKPSLLIGVIGCMAERLKEQLLEEDKSVDLVVGPDSYRDLPNLLRIAGSGQKAVNVMLSKEETYADIAPVKLDENNVTAFVTITRGCNNMCSYCVVPYTRGHEKSRSYKTILKEIVELFNKGYHEVTLLGQNVDSYLFKTANDLPVNFALLLEMVAKVSPLLRVRFATSHPKDMTDEVLYMMTRYPNICRSIHLPLQSGSSAILNKMKRRYTREWYMDRILTIRKIIPDCAISTDIISGFCSETEEDHQQTISLMKWVKTDFAFMFKYSERPGTFAAKNFKDDVPEDIKNRRLTEIINLQNKLSAESKLNDLDKTYEVLVEGFSKKSMNHLFGRTSQNKVVVFPKESFNLGDYVFVKIIKTTSATLIGKAIDELRLAQAGPGL